MKLEHGEVECRGCNGTGKMNRSTRIITSKKPYISTTSTESLTSFTCTKCHGLGKLDWIENVLGKRISKKETTTMHQGVSFPTNSIIGDLFYSYQDRHMYRKGQYGWEQIAEPMKNTLLNG